MARRGRSPSCRRGAHQNSGVSPLLPFVVLVPLMMRAPVRRRLSAATAVAVPAVALLLAYMAAQNAATSYFGLVPSSGFNQYARAAPFAHRRAFDPPTGTEALCERTDVRERYGGDYYAWDPRAPAWRLGLGPTDAAPELGEFAQAAILGQPWAHLHDVTRDLWRFVDLYGHIGAGTIGGTPDDMSIGLESAQGEALNRTVVDPYYGRQRIERGEVVGTLAEWQKILRMHGPLMLCAFVLSLAGAVVARGRALRALASLAVVGFVIPIVSVATVNAGAALRGSSSAGHGRSRRTRRPGTGAEVVGGQPGAAGAVGSSGSFRNRCSLACCVGSLLVCSLAARRREPGHGPSRRPRSSPEGDHPHAPADLDRRRRHRPAVVLPRARGRRDLGGDQQVHVHRAQPHVHRRLPDQVLRARAAGVGRRDRAPRSSARCSTATTSSPGIEIVSMADIPSGTGLGSSGAFTVGLLRAVYALKREHVTAGALAEEAAHIEIDVLGEPVGKQDQYIAAFGGLTCFEFHADDRVARQPAGDRPGDAARPRGAPAAVLHRLLARGGRRSSPTRSSGPSAATRAMLDEPRRRRRSSACEIGARSRPATPAAFGGAHARALGAQARALGGHLQRRRSTAGTRPGSAQRRASAASSSAPAPAGSCCSTPTTRAACARRWPSDGLPRCGSASTSTARSCSSRELTLRCSASSSAGGLGDADAAARPTPCRSRCCPSPGGRSPTTSSRWLAAHGRHRRRVLRSATSGDAIRDVRRRRHALGPARRATSTRARTCAARAGAAAARRRRRACSTTRSSCCTATRTSTRPRRGRSQTLRARGGRRC